MKVLIIEDEKIAADRLEQMLVEIEPDVQIMAKIDSVQQSIQWLSKNTVDLIFLDIQLSDGVSFTIFEKTDVKTPIIFTFSQPNNTTCGVISQLLFASRR